MITYTTWSESGGVGKTTFAVNLAAAHTRRGYNTLVIDLDCQDGGLTDHLGKLELRYQNPETNLVQHMAQETDAPLEDITETHHPDGFDFIPSHDMMRHIDRKLAAREELTEGYDKNEALRHVIERNNLDNKYDVLIVDPPTKPSPELRNAMFATRNILAPLEVTAKGETSVTGIIGEKQSLEHDLEINIGFYGIVPNNVQNTTIAANALENVHNIETADVAPIVIGERGALFGGAWDAEMSIFSFAERKKDRLRSYERPTLQKMQYLADIITNDVVPHETALEDLGAVVKRPSETRIHDEFKQTDAATVEKASGDA